MSDYVSSNERRTYDSIRQGADRLDLHPSWWWFQPQNWREKCKVCDKYCNESRSGAPRKHQNRFRPAFRPRLRWGSSRCSQTP